MSSSRPSAALDCLIDSLVLEPSPQPLQRQAMTSPRLDSPKSSRSGTMKSVMPRGDSSMPPMMGSESESAKGQHSVQPVAGPSVRNCRRSPREEAFAALDTVPEPFSYRSASRHLGWDYYEARRWMREGARLKRYSVAREGHRKTDAARRVG